MAGSRAAANPREDGYEMLLRLRELLTECPQSPEVRADIPQRMSDMFGDALVSLATALKLLGQCYSSGTPPAEALAKVSHHIAVKAREVDRILFATMTHVAGALRVLMEARIDPLLLQGMDLLRLVAATGERVPPEMGAGAGGASQMRIQRTAEALARLVVSTPALQGPWTNRSALKDAVETRLRVLADAKRELQQELEEEQEQEEEADSAADAVGEEEDDETAAENATATPQEDVPATAAQEESTSAAEEPPQAEGTASENNDADADESQRAADSSPRCVTASALALLEAGEELVRSLFDGIVRTPDASDWKAWDLAKRLADEMANAIDSAAALSYPPLDRGEMRRELAVVRARAKRLSDLGRAELAESGTAGQWPALADAISHTATELERAVDSALGLGPEE